MRTPAIGPGLQRTQKSRAETGEACCEERKIEVKVFKRGSIYWFELVFKGQRVQRSTRTKYKRDAEHILSTFHAALTKGEVGIIDRKPVPTFAAAMKSFLEEQRKASSQRRYKVSAVALLRYFRNLPLDKIGWEDSERFKKSRELEFGTRRGNSGARVSTGKRVRPATVNRELA